MDLELCSAVSRLILAVPKWRQCNDLVASFEPGSDIQPAGTLVPSHIKADNGGRTRVRLPRAGLALSTQGRLRPALCRYSMMSFDL